MVSNNALLFDAGKRKKFTYFDETLLRARPRSSALECRKHKLDRVDPASIFFVSISSAFFCSLVLLKIYA